MRPSSQLLLQQAQGTIDSTKNIRGFYISTPVSAVWHLEEGDYEYWVGKIMRMNYNICL